jgi:hypothetical protein
MYNYECVAPCECLDNGSGRTGQGLDTAIPDVAAYTTAAKIAWLHVSAQCCDNVTVQPGNGQQTQTFSVTSFIHNGNCE